MFGVDFEFSETEQRIADILSDGQPHPLESLLPCLGDPLGKIISLYPHFTRMRSKLRPHGYDLISQNGSYRWMRNLPSAVDGKR